MSVEQGNVPFKYQVQPDRTIVENTDGTMDGSVVYVTRASYIDFLPELEDPHPDDDRLEMHTREITRTRHNLVTMTAHFRGLVDDPTEPVISYIGSPDRERVETHPDFTNFAGTSSSPANGALWVDYETNKPSTKNTAVFVGFTTNTSAELYGVEYYLAASTQITLTHWQTKVPVVQRMVIVQPEDLEKAVRGFKSPDDVTDYLLLDTPYRQIGNLYQVSKIYLGSRGGGWSETLYPQS